MGMNSAMVSFGLIILLVSSVVAESPPAVAETCKGQNEEYTDCINIQCTPTTCEEVVKMPYYPSTEPGDCSGGCKCKNGFVRSNNGTCIAITDCPEAGTCTDQNQAWEECAVNCANAYCPKDDQEQPICFLPAGVCHPGCKCKQNYRISEDNSCIPARDCPPVNCTRPNEEYNSCPKNGITLCAQLGTTPVTDTEPTICNPGCVCKKGFYKNDNGTCVVKCECQTDDSVVPVPVTSVPGRCPPNEELKLRGACPPDSCEMLYLSVLCIANQTQELLCTCKSGYLRRNTTCVPEDRCLPPECADDPNAIRGCGNRCGKTCEDYNNTTKVCNNNICHINGCDCKDGLVYDQNTRRCVKPEQCSKQCKGSHEIYIDCPAGQCNAKTCDDLVKPPACPRIIPPCPGGCVCEYGYLRDKSGKCIPKEQCPSVQCKKKNERWSNCVIGECVPRTCEDVGYPVACPDIIGPCAGGCTCIEGFVRNCEGECIDMKNCPHCGGDPNAVSGCGNPCGKTCASLFANNSDLVCPQYCEYNGCDCKPGYLLLTNSTDSTESKKCVPKSECPKPIPQCEANEQYYCGTSCPEASCVNPTPPTCVNKKCKLGCFCKKGFVRDSNDKCIPVNNCTKCKGPHERLISCPAGQCNPKTCKDLIIPPGCPRVIPPCPDGCICEEGYLRDADGKCIEKSLCPKPSCNANETYASCAIKCPDKNCPIIDGPQPVCDPDRDCSPGCICKINYRYDQSGKCILASECPPVKCNDPNAKWESCPSACLNEQCEAADSPPVTCNTLLLNCNPRCVCKPGYFKHPETRLCVPAKECPGVCKDPNASWKDCRDPCPGTCQNTKPICLSKACSSGCQCNEGYVLSNPGEEGKCVKIETCADYADCPANQTFVPCTFKCPQVSCPESDQTILCKPPRDCSGGCGCKPYYRYDSNGNCIKASDCPQVKCTRSNEEWKCKHVGDWENCDERYNTPPFWAGDPDDCEPKCVCQKGYWRNPQTNMCVTENECPPSNE